MLCSGLDWGRKGGKARGGDKFLTRPEIRVKKAGPHFLRTPRKKMFGTRSYIIVTFAFLFWLYYVASGGGAFEPEQWPEVPVARVQPAPVPEPEPEPVIAEEIAPAAVEHAPAADGAAMGVPESDLEAWRDTENYGRDQHVLHQQNGKGAPAIAAFHRAPFLQ